MAAATGADESANEVKAKGVTEELAPHARRGTRAMTENLSIVPRRRVTYDASLLGPDSDSEKSDAVRRSGTPRLTRTDNGLPKIGNLFRSGAKDSSKEPVVSLPVKDGNGRSFVRRQTVDPDLFERLSTVKSKSTAALRAFSREPPTMGKSLSNKERPMTPASSSKERLVSPEDKLHSVSEEIVRQGMARRLCRKYEIEQQEACRILEIFEREAAQSDDAISISGFRHAVRAIAAHRDLNENGVQQAWKLSTPWGKTADAGITVGGVDMSAFVQWWVMEEKWAHLRAACAWVASPETLQELADERGVDVPELTRVKGIYDVFDDNGTGIMDFSEFGDALKDLLKMEEPPTEECAKRHWKALDQDDCGEVDFPEFARWYLETFDKATKVPIET